MKPPQLVYNAWFPGMRISGTVHPGNPPGITALSCGFTRYQSRRSVAAASYSYHLSSHPSPTSPVKSVSQFDERHHRSISISGWFCCFWFLLYPGNILVGIIRTSWMKDSYLFVHLIFSCLRQIQSSMVPLSSLFSIIWATHCSRLGSAMNCQALQFIHVYKTTLLQTHQNSLFMIICKPPVSINICSSSSW